MKSLIDCINESVLPQPELGMDCTGADGGKYTVVDWCYLCEKELIRKMCKKYDESGAMWDEWKRGKLPRRGILVALEDDSDKSTSVWQWDPLWIKKAWM